MKNHILTLAVALATNVAIAQAPKEEFKVLSQKGPNEHNSKPLTTGTKLNASDKLSVGNGGYIGLLHKSGKTLELKVVGTYSVAELSQKVAATNVSTSKRYTDFILGELTKESEDINKNHKKHMSTTGSVERAIKEDISLLLPSSSGDKKLFASESGINLVWKNKGAGKTYIVKLENSFGEPLYTKETTDTTISVAHNELKLNNENSYNIVIEEKGNTKKSDVRQVIVNKDKELQEKINELNNNLTEDNSLNNYLKATFYRENNIFDKAAEYYLKAIKADPEVTDYKEAYLSFLKEHNLENHLAGK